MFETICFFFNVKQLIETVCPVPIKVPKYCYCYLHIYMLERTYMETVDDDGVI